LKAKNSANLCQKIRNPGPVMAFFLQFRVCYLAAAVIIYTNKIGIQVSTYREPLWIGSDTIPHYRFFCGNPLEKKDYEKARRSEACFHAGRFLFFPEVFG
jgi:hypothetical protein